ncbi:hypothetical protein [Streptomyces sp. NPDC054952]
MLGAQALLQALFAPAGGEPVLDGLGAQLAGRTGPPDDPGLAVLVTTAPPGQGNPKQPLARIADVGQRHRGQTGSQPLPEPIRSRALAELTAYLTDAGG